MAVISVKYWLLFSIIMVSLYDDIYGQIFVRVVDIQDDMLTNITHLSKATYESQTRMEHQVTQMTLLLQAQYDEQRKLTTALGIVVEQMNRQNQLIGLLQSTPADCTDLTTRGPYTSGPYTIQPSDDSGNLRVHCDMDTDNGGWTVFQRRFDGSVSFYRRWHDYEEGFGSAHGEYWLGLRHIYRLLQHGTWVLRVDLEDFSNNTAYAEYESFSVAHTTSNHQLSIGAYSGTANDSLIKHNNRAFSTPDRGKERSCATSRRGGWWYHACADSNLNGLYLGEGQVAESGMSWYHWKNSYEVLKRSEMKMRRVR